MNRPADSFEPPAFHHKSFTDSPTIETVCIWSFVDVCGKLYAERGGIGIPKQTIVRQGERWNGAANPERIKGSARVSAELLFGLGVNPQQYGYDVLRDGVRVTAEQMTRCRRQPFDALFPLLGEICGRKEERAGQEMYDVLRTCWDTEERERRKEFPFAKCPTAPEAVYALAERVRDRVAAKTNRTRRP